MELESTMNEMKYPLERLTAEQTEERISELEDRPIEIIQMEEQEKHSE